MEVLRGQPQRARAIIGAMKDAKREPAALVVLASIALDEGFTRDASLIAGRLRVQRPDAVEGRLLEALAKEREEHPRGDWLSAGLAAVGKLQPVAPSAPLIDPWDRVRSEYLSGRPPPFPEEKTAALSLADAFLARWAWPRAPMAKPSRALVDQAIRLACADESSLVHRAVLDVLDSLEEGQAAVPPDAVVAARRAVISKLRDTPAGRRRLVTMPKRAASEPVDEDEVAAFEAAVAEEIPPSYAGDYLHLLRLLEPLDLALAQSFAMGGAVSLIIPPPFVLNLGDRVATGGMTVELRNRLASALVRWAEQERREDLILTDMLAAMAFARAGDLRNDPTLKARSVAIRAEADRLRDSYACLGPLIRLPIRSLQQAWARQVPSESTLARRAAAMGLSCPETRKPEPVPDSEPERPCPDDATPAKPSQNSGSK